MKNTNTYKASLIASFDTRIKAETKKDKLSVVKQLTKARDELSNDIICDFMIQHKINHDFVNMKERKDAFINIKSVQEIVSILRALTLKIDLREASAKRFAFASYAHAFLRFVNEQSSDFEQFSNATLRAVLSSNVTAKHSMKIKRALRLSYDASTANAQTSIFRQACIALNIAQSVTQKDESAQAERHALKFYNSKALTKKVLALAI